MDYHNHLYMILYPNPSLVASQCEPEAFSKHYQIGSTRYYTGKLIFAEIDPLYRHPYFDIEAGLRGLIPHEDGAPKATKFISSYRVLEHVDLQAIQRLYLATPNGEIIGIDPGKSEGPSPDSGLRVIAQICPLSMLVLTRLSSDDFGRYITDPANPKGAPVIFYTSLDLDITGFLKDFEANPFLPAPLAFMHPSKLRDAIIELQTHPEKTTKGLALRTPLGSVSYKSVRKGFWFYRPGHNLFFPFPALSEIELTHYKFWRAL